MNDVVLCDKELNNVMDVESINLSSVHNVHYQEIVLSEFPEESNMQHNDGLKHYIAIDDLPTQGDPSAVYKIDSTGDLFVFRNNQYCDYNPYAVPSEQITAPRVMIEDDSAFMPHGGMGPLAVIYNVHALRRDLVLKQIMGWDWVDMIPNNMAGQIPKTPDQEKKLRNLYFRTSHKALLEQLRTHLRHRCKRGEFRKDYVDALDRIGVSVWFTEHEYGFKDGDFVVTFA